MAAPTKTQPRKWLVLVCRIVGYTLLAAVGLVVASPVLLLLLFLLVVLLVLVLLVLGFVMGLASAAAVILHCLLGLPFWFWMIFTGLGAVLFFIGMLAPLFSDTCDHAGTRVTAKSPSTCSTWPWLMVGLLIGDWWGDHDCG